eukprot:TRINITY_DN8073_c7_g1_i1.p1 TRINITY_DN8073_c7_g1~~TRINITY_DN8073_c7_g1_i1.p1  ORF type:complete len:675 (+),score=143.36 TRINITY_DN8073_c7_g1_i1:88-2025(+)
MPASGAAAAWASFAERAQQERGATEESLVLTPLPEIRQMLRDFGFDPLASARAEVQWQVLQATHPSVRCRGYAEDMRRLQSQPRGREASPPADHRGESDPELPPEAGLTPLNPDPPSNATFPQQQQQEEAPAEPPPDSPAVVPPPAAAPAAPAAQGAAAASPPPAAALRQTQSPRRCDSPRRVLGSPDGVERPASLRRPRPASPRPSVRSQYPVVHPAEWEVSSPARGPHLSRRLPLNTREAEWCGPNPNTISGPTAAPSPRRTYGSETPRLSDPNSCTAQGSDPQQRRGLAAGVNSPLRVPPRGSDPNPTAPEPVPRGCRMVETAVAMRGRNCRSPLDPRRDPEPSSPSGLRMVRAKASESNLCSQLNSVTEPERRSGLGGRAVPAQLSGSNPNPAAGNGPCDDCATGTRKGRAPSPKEPREKAYRFNPGPPDGGVVPGTHSWEHAQPDNHPSRRVAPSNPAGSDPNTIKPDQQRGLHFFGGAKAVVPGKRSAENAVGDALQHSANRDREEQASAREFRDFARPADPNALVPSGPLPVRPVRPPAPGDRWGGVSGAPAPAGDSARTSRKRYFGEAEQPPLPASTPHPVAPPKPTSPARDRGFWGPVGQVGSPMRMYPIERRAKSFSPQREYTGRFVPAISGASK